MSDFREMLFSKTIEPKNWQELQARDEAKWLFIKARDEAMQKEIDDQLTEDDDYQDTGMSRSDFYSGSTY